MLRTEIINIARSYIGTPFHHQGRKKGVGIDCVGLLVCVMRECGIEVEDQANYNGLIDEELLRSKLDAHLSEISIAQVLPGDILLFRIGKIAQHVAIISSFSGLQSPDSSLSYIGIIHTHRDAGRVIESNMGGWEKRIVSAYMFREVES